MEDWAQVGGDINGDASGASLGYDVWMSGDSTMIGALGSSTSALKLFKRNTCNPTHPPSSMPTRTFNCADEIKTLQINITTDRSSHETSWSLKNLQEETILTGGPYVKKFTSHSESYCLDPTGCYVFTIKDLSGDGICCDWFTGNGTYTVMFDSVVIKVGGNFKSEEKSIPFGLACPSLSPSISSFPSSRPSNELCPIGTYVDGTKSDSERCQPCPPGSYQNIPTRNESCIPCDRGTYQPNKGSQTCIACARGSYQGQIGQTECKECEQGGYCNENYRKNADGGFVPCVPGTYNNKIGQYSEATCLPCQAGTYQPNKGQSKCSPCKKGSYQGLIGQTSCDEKCRTGGYCDIALRGTCNGGFKPCKAGTYNDKVGQYSEEACIPCKVGEYTDKNGLAECLPCPHRLSSPPNSSSCSFCSEGFYLNEPQASITEIFRKPTEYCQTCPQNAKCPSNTTIQTLHILPNYWRDSLQTATIYPCNHDGVCIGYNANTLSKNLHLLTDPYCKDGHSGPLCEVCEMGKFFDETSGECFGCPTFRKVIVISSVIIAICVGIIVVYIVTTSTTKGKQLVNVILAKMSVLGLQTKIKIIISFYQMIAIIEPVYGIRIDKQMKAWLDFLGIFRFNLINFIIPSQCLGSMNIYIILGSLWPFILISVLIMGMIIHTAHSKKSTCCDHRIRETICFKSLHLTIIVVYFALPTVSNSIFDAIRCQSFLSNDNTGISNSYLLADRSIKCDKSDDMYEELLTIFWLFFTIWPILMPLLCGGLLWYIRKSIMTDCITNLSDACGFLWRDYRKGMMAWELIDITRKITLTGLLLFIDIERGSEKLLRVVIAAVISTTYLGILALTRPYKRTVDLHLSFVSATLQIAFFLMGIVIQICNKGEEICQGFIGTLDSYNASVLAVTLTGGMFLISILAILFVSRTTDPIPTIHVKSTKSKPNLEMSDSCHFHIFLSHVWSTGQDKAQKIARMLQLHVPGIRVWLDVDELENISGDSLAKSVGDSELFVLVYSSGYFRSENCRKEVCAAFTSNKPTLLLYEGDAKTLDTMRSECKLYFASEADDVLNHILRNNAILWLGSCAQPLAFISINLLVLCMLRELPFYWLNSSQLDQGLQLGTSLDSSTFVYPNTLFVFENNFGIDNVLDALEKGQRNKVSTIRNEAFTDKLQSDVSRDVVLLYLRKSIFEENDATFKNQVENALENGMQFVLVHEQDSDESCEFGQIIKQTPEALLARGIYSSIAVPLYTKTEYRKISMHLLMKKISDVCSS